MRWTAVRIIHAPADRVFHTVAEPEEFHRAIPDGENVQSRGSTRRGVGTKSRAHGPGDRSPVGPRDDPADRSDGAAGA